MAGEPAFYFDLASAQAYLAAERVLQAMPVATPWVPVLERGLSEADAGRPLDRGEIERRAALAGLQPLRWPDPFPFDSERSMLAATYARSIGRVVPYALAAFRQAFAGGHRLDSDEAVVIAGAACEMHPKALLAGAATRATRAALVRATKLAAERGVRETPAVWVPGAGVFSGPDCLERAADCCGSAA